MSGINKRDLILEAIIKTYLEDSIPIGSCELGSRMKTNIPASTVRVYFKKLSQEGVIAQVHSSSGRIPTNIAMKRYWDSRIKIDEVLPINDKYSFGDIVDEFGIYCLVGQEDGINLNEIINVEDRFLILVFDNDEITIKYNHKIQKFLENFLGTSIESLINICSNVGLLEISKRAKALLESKILFQGGKKYIYNFFSEDANNEVFELFFDVIFARNLKNGIVYDEILPQGYIAIKQDTIFCGNQAKILCLGDLYTDFERFFNRTKENS